MASLVTKSPLLPSPSANSVVHLLANEQAYIFPKLAGRALDSPFHICEFCTSIMIYDQYSISPRLITRRRRLLVDLASASSEITV